MTSVYLLWLEWPEKCFRVDAEALRFFHTLVPKGSRVIRARTERAFLRALPVATHAIVWEFKPEWFALAPRLKLLATPAAGRELVPTTGPKDVRIHFGGFHGAIISETVIAFALAWAHGFFRRVPLWPRSNLGTMCYDFAGTRAVIVGYGRVGRAIGEKFERMGAEVYGLTRHGVYRQMKKIPSSRSTSFRHLVSSADWLVMALPGDTGTDDFLDAKMLARLPRRAVVINVGRGNSVDEAALVSALRCGRIAAAYLDVYKNEPTIIQKVMGRRQTCDIANMSAADLPPNLIRMPHSSAFSPNYMKLCFKELKDEGLV